MLDTCPKWSSSWYAVQFSIFMNVARGRIPVLPSSLLLYHYQLCTLLGVWMMFWHCINFSGGRVSPTRDCSICEVGWENPHGCCPSSQPASQCPYPNTAESWESRLLCFSTNLPSCPGSTHSSLPVFVQGLGLCPQYFLSVQSSLIDCIVQFSHVDFILKM